MIVPPLVRELEGGGIRPHLNPLPLRERILYEIAQKIVF